MNTRKNETMATRGWFAYQIEAGDEFCGKFGNAGEWIILDQGNEIPEELLPFAPCATADEAIERCNAMCQG